MTEIWSSHDVTRLTLAAFALGIIGGLWLCSFLYEFFHDLKNTNRIQPRDSEGRFSSHKTEAYRRTHAELWAGKK